MELCGIELWAFHVKCLMYLSVSIFENGMKTGKFPGENELIQQLNIYHKIGSKKILRLKMQMAWVS